MNGGRGRDRVSGGAGRDRLTGGGKSDRINARDGEADVVRCGTGRDRVKADARTSSSRASASRRRASAFSPRKRPALATPVGCCGTFAVALMRTSRTARAMPRSWIARPVESKRVMSSAPARPSASPASTAPSSVTSLAIDDPGARRRSRARPPSTPAPIRRRRACSARSLPARPRPFREHPRRGPRGAGPAAGPGEHDRLVARGHRHDHVLCGGLLARPAPPSELARESVRGLGARVRANAFRVADGGETPSRPRAVHPTADQPHRPRVIAGERLG